MSQENREGSPTDELDYTSPKELLTEAGRDELFQALKKIKTQELIVEEKDKYIHQLQHSLKMLASKMKSVAQYIDVREDVEDRLQIMERHHQEEIARYQKISKDARLELLEKKLELRVQEQTLKQQHDQEVARQANLLLDARTRQINAQNFELLKDKLVLSRDTELSREQNKKLTAENLILRQKQKISEANEAELLHRSVMQKKQVTALKTQIKTTEDNIEKIVEQKNKELIQQEKKYAKEMSKVTQERDEARSLAFRLRTELQRIRAASALVASFQTDIQVFFHEALQEVRAEILEERRRELIGMKCGEGLRKPPHTLSSAYRLAANQPLLLKDSTDRPKREWVKDRNGFPIAASSLSSSIGPLPALRQTTSPVDKFSKCFSAEKVEKEKQLATPVDSSGFDDDWGSHSDGSHSLALRKSPVSGFTDRMDPYGPSVRPGSASDEAELVDTQPYLTQPQMIPNSFTLKELQKVDVRQLTWTEKEEVLLYLFKRLQRKPRGEGKLPLSDANTSETPSDEPMVQASAEQCTFLTQDTM